MRNASLTIVIPTSGASPHIEALIEDLASQTVAAEAVHVVVNDSEPVALPQRWQHGATVANVSYLSRGHYYAKGVNFALRRVETKYVAVINDDVRLQPTWVEAIVEGFAHHPGYGSLASRVVSLRDESVLDSCGDSLYLCGRASANGWLEPVTGWRDPCEVFSTAGCVAAYRVSDLRRAGFLDESFVAYMEDVDLGFRLQLLGRPCLYWPAAEAGHIGGATRKTPRYAARLAERNSILTVVKNMPGGLLPAALPDFIAGHSSPCSFEGWRSWSAWRRGGFSAACALPDALAKRREVQASRRVSNPYIRSILKPGRPSVCHL
jgi:GT2 family glycosyltransferase